MFDLGQAFGGAIIALGVAAIAGYISKRYWVAALVGGAFCFVSIAPIPIRILSAVMCIALVGAFAGLRKLRAKPQANTPSG